MLKETHPHPAPTEARQARGQNKWHPSSKHAVEFSRNARTPARDLPAPDPRHRSPTGTLPHIPTGRPAAHQAHAPPIPLQKELYQHPPPGRPPAHSGQEPLFTPQKNSTSPSAQPCPPQIQNRQRLAEE